MSTLLQREFGDEGNLYLFQSCAIPTKRSWGVDVDFILLSGKRAVLIDAKVGKANTFMWGGMFGGKHLMENGGYARVKNRQTGVMEKRELKATMNMAKDIYSQELRKFGVTQVTALTIFVPPTEKSRGPASVWALRYPGGVRTYLAPSGLRVIRKSLGAMRKKTNPEAVRYLQSMVKR